MPNPLQLIPDEHGSAYQVRLPVFEGPLDLLLHLIEREELDITEVSLVAVTDQYLKALDELEEIETGALADFLVVAARLVYIKSRSLLPKPRPPEEDGEEDPGDALIKQLLEYRRFKEVAAGLQRREEAGLRVFVRMAPLPELERKLDLSDVDIEGLYAAVQQALRRMPSDPPLPRVHTYPISVAEQIQVIRQHVSTTPEASRGKPIRFSQLLSGSRSRMEIVVTFLAVLELIKQHEIEAHQDEVFGDILLSPKAKPGPNPDAETDPETGDDVMDEDSGEASENTRTENP
jgi:segregation and condensation protein A